MSAIQLFRWQWGGYTQFHQSRANLVLHIFVVPLFLAANILFVVALLQAWWLVAVLSLAAMAVSVALQGRGHAREPVPPEPFTSPLNAVGRIVLEQWVTFPRFVFSGGWTQAMRSAATARQP